MISPRFVPILNRTIRQPRNAVALHIVQNVETLLPKSPEMGRPGRVPGTRELVIPSRTPKSIF